MLLGFLTINAFFAEHLKKMSWEKRNMTYNNMKKQILDSTTVVTQREISFHQRKTWLNNWQTLLGINNTLTEKNNNTPTTLYTKYHTKH